MNLISTLRKPLFNLISVSNTEKLATVPQISKTVVSLNINCPAWSLNAHHAKFS